MRTLLRKRERGQVIVIAALLLPLLMGMTAVAVDIGSYSSDRRNLQNAADAVALAAANDLPDSNKAMGTANQYAIKNHISPSDMTVTISGGNTAPQVRVVISVSHNFSFIRALGVNSKAVSGTATAAKVSFGGSNGIVPWGVTQSTVDAAGDGQLITLKYDSTGGTQRGAPFSRSLQQVIGDFGQRFLREGNPASQSTGRHRCDVHPSAGLANVSPVGGAW